MSVTKWCYSFCDGGGISVPVPVSDWSNCGDRGGCDDLLNGVDGRGRIDNFGLETGVGPWIIN